MGQNFEKKSEIFENKIFVDKYDLIYWINGLALLMNSVSGLHLHPLRYVINIAGFDCVVLCFKLHGRTYTRYDVYGNYDCVIVA